MLSLFASEAPTVSIGPEVLFQLGPITVTNTLLTGIIGSAIIIALFMATVRGIKSGKLSRLGHFMFWMFETMYDTAYEVIGDREVTRKTIPYAVTLVFFFAINNWL